jgi:hypothetical protein
MIGGKIECTKDKVDNTSRAKGENVNQNIEKNVLKGILES